MKRNYQTRSKDGGNDQPSRRTTKQPRQQPTDQQLDSKYPCFRRLPPEIIPHILMRAPVKTLLKLKCLNRYFYGFLSSEKFISDHIKFKSEGDTSLAGYRAIVRSNKKVSSFVIEQVSVQSLGRQSSVRSIILDYPKKDLRGSVRLVGSCNGLVFIIVSVYLNHMLIWNPAIKKHKRLPGIGKLEDFRQPGYFYSHYGFGCDASNDDYKVVALFQCYGVGYFVRVYSLTRGSWKKIPDYMGDLLREYFGKFASGQLHWVTNRGSVITFDMETEVFGKLRLPSWDEGCSDVSLSVMGVSVCVSYYYNEYIDVWVMKEYGKKESWTNIITLPGLFFASPCSILQYGEVLINKGSSLCIYDPRSNSWSEYEICQYYDPIIYVESLVSPC